MKMILAVPFYKNEEFIDNIGNFFLKNQKEKELFESILIINDCPVSDKSDYLELSAEKFGFEFIKNEKNVGYLNSANVAFGMAKAKKSGLILLNSDTLPHGQCFTELVSCLEYDASLACVAPRSNHATICNVLEQPHFIEGPEDFEYITRVFEDSKKYVPKINYVPVTNGFCLCIKAEVIQIFGGFDDFFNPGYEEENDYCLRLGEHGYRLGIANHALIGHLEGRSFGLNSGREELKKRQYQKLIERYPYYETVLKRSSDDIGTRCYRFIIGCIKHGLNTVLVDARNLGDYHNGTNKLIVEVVKALCDQGYNVEILASEMSMEFHGIKGYKNLIHIDIIKKYYFLGLKIGQPFDHSSLFLVPAHSYKSVNIFFDTIAMDCPQLRGGEVNVESFWEKINSVYTHVFFISDFAKIQFQRFFGKNGVDHHSALLPIEVGIESEHKEKDSTLPDKYAIIIGNNYKHKGIEIALQELPKQLSLKYIVIADDCNVARDDLIYMKPGYIPEQMMISMFANCEYIIFPSFAEGFGYPIIDALKYSKDIYCRPLPSFIEIRDALNLEQAEKIKFVSDFSDLIPNNCDAGRVRPKENSAVFSYQSYVQSILHKTSLTDASTSYERLIARLILLNSVNTTYVNFNIKLIPILILKEIYRMLLSSPYGRPIAKAGVKVYKRIMK